MERQRDYPQRKSANSPNRKLRKARVLCEKPHKQRGTSLADTKHNRSKTCAKKNDPPKSLSDPGCIARPIIKAQNWLGSPSNPRHGHGNQLHIALHHCGAGDEGISIFWAPIPLQHTVHNDNEDTVCCTDDKRRKTKCHYPAHNAKRIAAKA